ncbi:helix-turn-helix domain-containing protein [Aliidiomarina soli]|uniref:XRE family transcriptional regulator n=1 Tax=Aliidiomarina soli TaxID=1928574 RepID=A0A432WHI4_9GAMM|nr:XRE family transcriptional regulator [Aliidiomarina soli]RUO33177.1 XRE family transcriptional regulator [Aliidiomarina soli]
MFHYKEQKVNIMTEASNESVNTAIAKRVNQFRKEHGLSFDELARRAEISKGMIVQIEKGRANPSIGVLCKLANALSVSVADIVDISEGSNIKVNQPNDIPTLWHGEQGGTARLLAGTKGAVMVELWRWEMFAGEAFKSDPHSKGTIELIYVEQGCLTVVVNEKPVTLEQGMSVTVSMDVPHAYENRSNSAVRFTMSVYEKSGY